MRVVAMRDIRALGFDLLAHLFLKVQGRDPEDLAGELAEFPELAMVATCSGSPQVVVQINARDRAHLIDCLSTTVSRVDGVAEVETNFALKIVKFDSRFGSLLDRPAPIVDDGSGTTDDRILALLEHDARLGNREIGRRLGFSEALIRKCVKRLTEAGAMRLGALLEPQAFGLTSAALVQFKVAPQHLLAVADILSQHENSSYVSLTTGVYNLMAVSVMPDHRAHAFKANSMMHEVPGISDIRINELLSVHKTHYNIVRI